MKRQLLTVIAFVFALSAFSGCGLFEQTASGTLVLQLTLNEKIASRSITDMAEARSIVPASPWVPQSYQVSGTGPDGAVFSVESAQTCLKQRLAPGEWTCLLYTSDAADE